MRLCSFTEILLVVLWRKLLVLKIAEGDTLKFAAGNNRAFRSLVITMTTDLANIAHSAAALRYLVPVSKTLITNLLVIFWIRLFAFRCVVKLRCPTLSTTLPLGTLERFRAVTATARTFAAFRLFGAKTTKGWVSAHLVLTSVQGFSSPVECQIKNSK